MVKRRVDLSVPKSTAPAIAHPLDDLGPPVLKNRPHLDLDRKRLTRHYDMDSAIPMVGFGPTVLDDGSLLEETSDLKDDVVLLIEVSTRVEADSCHVLD